LYTKIFAEELPVPIVRAIKTPAMERLKGIGMHCGCDYSNIFIYKNVRMPYSRYTHSVAVAKIIWHFTQDVVQTFAGLLHDIATPVFAHSIDFMYGDYLTQEATEDATALFIMRAPEIMALLKEYKISVEAVSDYHLYPVADNDTPKLSADRLEYTLGNAYILYHTPLEILQEIYEDIILVENNEGEVEMCFSSLRMARKFTELALQNAYLYVSNEDRFMMQYIADIIKYALEEDILQLEDLDTTEAEVIQKLQSDKRVNERWEIFTQLKEVRTIEKRKEDIYICKVPAKKRYIDTLVRQGNAVRRISEIDADIKRKIDTFLALCFDIWLTGIS
jgi:hypothetical protein